MTEPRHVLVVGAGPAGLAAAAAVAVRGMRVTLIDAQSQAGGQVWRKQVGHPAHVRVRRALARGAGVTHRFGMQVVDGDAAAHMLRIETRDGTADLHWDRLVLASGARELFLPFPGWTLPGVTGAGGLQALVKQGWPIAGRRVVVAGSGPLLLAAAAVLRAHGAQVLAVLEQARRAQVLAFGRSLWRWPDKLVQAAHLRMRVTGTPFRYGTLVRRATGDDHLQGVDIECDGKIEHVACDHLAAGFGLVPETALARLLGCACSGATHPVVQVDELQRTTLSDVFAAGECCGIGGMRKAWVEGTIAGCAAADDEAAARKHFAARRRARDFADALARTFALDPRARTLAEDSTVVCRCEDVTRGALRGYGDARSAKLGTRCGMGPCQGRICGAAMAELAGWSWHGHARAPVFPARLATLAATIRSESAAPSSPTAPDRHPGARRDPFS